MNQIMDFSENLFTSFEKWATTGELDGIAVEGFTVESIVRETGMKIPAVYLAMNILEKDAEYGSFMIGYIQAFG